MANDDFNFEGFNVNQGSEPATTEQTPSEVNSEQTPVVEQAPIVETPQPVFNPKEIFGDKYESVDLIKSRLEEYEIQSQKIQELESKQVTFANDYVRELNDALTKGISEKAFNQVYFSDPSKLTPAEKLELSLQWEKDFTPEEAKLYIEDKYKLGPDEDPDDRSVQVARLMMKADVKEAEKFLEQYRQKQLTPPSQPDNTQIVKAWEPIIPKLVDEVKSVTVNNIPYNFSQEILNQAKDEVMNLIATDFQGDAKNPEHMAFIRGVFTDRVKALSFDSAIQYFLTEQTKQKIKEEANPSKELGTKNLGTSESKAQSEVEALANFLAKQY